MFATLNSSNYWPTGLEGIEVSVGGLPATILAVSSDSQFPASTESYNIDFVVPDGAPPGPNVLVTVTDVGSSQTQYFNVEVQQSSPALWSIDGATEGEALAIAQDANLHVAFTANHAIPTDGNTRVVLYATGTRALVTAGSLIVRARDARGREHVLPVEYAGPQSGLLGLDQIIVRITSELAGLNKIDVWIEGGEDGQVILPLK